MTFPNKKYNKISEFTEEYIKRQSIAIKNLDLIALEDMSKLIERTYLDNRTLYVCGNGGSAAIANHMVCDHGKLVGTDTNVRVKICSLSNSIEMITALSNDLSYDEIYSYQIKNLGEYNDTLLTISASGNSPNIIKAMRSAKELGLNVISFTGFCGGESSKLSDININVNSDNYGIIEDVFQSLMQIVAQFIRMNNMNENLIKKRHF